MSRAIKLYWDINNDAIDEAIRKFEELQKKAEEAAQAIGKAQAGAKDGGAIRGLAGLSGGQASGGGGSGKPPAGGASLGGATPGAGGNLGGLNQAKETLSEMGGMMDGLKEKTGGLLKGFGGWGAAMSAAVGAGKMLADVLQTGYSAVISAAAESEKLKVNLALAFQSANVGGKSYEENLKLAESAMLRIQELAAKTPFDVNELTDSYIKLTKRGLRPTEEQLLALGNLASFSGNSIDQLSEAILDAQQGSKERLKEFGIDMKVESGKVKLAIGDIAVEGEKIVETFAKLGEAPGINEAMIKQSETLSGVFNTMKDTFTQFLGAVGSSPAIFETLKTAAGPLTAIFEGLKLSAFAFGEALGEPLKALADSIFPATATAAGGMEGMIKRIALTFVDIADIIKAILVPIFKVLGRAFQAIKERIVENNQVFGALKVALKSVIMILRKIWEVVEELIDAVVSLIAGLAELTLGIIGGLDGFKDFVVVLQLILEVCKDIINAFLVWAKILSKDVVGGLGAILRGDFVEGFQRISRGLAESAKALVDGLINSFSDLGKKKLKIRAELEKEATELPPPKKGELPAGADLAPVTSDNAKAEKEEDLEKKRLEQELELLQKLEIEKRRHAEAVIAIEKEALKNRELNETKTRKLAEETLLHEQKLFEEKEELLKKENEIKRKIVEREIAAGKKTQEDLAFFDKKVKKEKEEREYDHQTKMIELAHNASEARRAELIAMAEFERRIEERRLDDLLEQYKKSLEREKALAQDYANQNHHQENATNLRILQLERKQAEAEFEIAKKKLQNKLELHKQYNTLTIEQELELKAELERLEFNHNAKMTELADQAARERFEIEKELAETRKRLVESIIEDTDKALKKGLGDSVGEAIMNIATLKKSLTDLREQAEKEIARLKSIGTQEALDMAAMLEKKLAKDSMKAIVSQVGEAISGVVAALNDTINKIQALRIAKIDEQIKKNNEEIEQLKQKAELEKQRNEELLRRQEIDNKLAQQRINELTQLQSSIPESERNLVKEQIEIQKSRIKDVEKLKNEAANKESERVRRLEEENKRLEEQKRKVQREQFEINRAAQIAQTIISGALAAVNAFASLAAIPIAGPGLGAAAAATIGVFTATQVALIAAQPNPYQKGTLFVEGDKKDKDSVPALLQPGEAVIPAKENKDYKEAIKTIFYRQIEPKTLNAIVKNVKIKKLSANDLFEKNIIVANTFDTAPIVEAINNKPVASVNIDEDGLEVYINNVNAKTRILNKKLRIQ